jgi:DNA repair protein RadC
VHGTLKLRIRESCGRRSFETQRLRDALALVDIRVLDHLVVAGASVVSFAEKGLL